MQAAHARLPPLPLPPRPSAPPLADRKAASLEYLNTTFKTANPELYAALKAEASRLRCELPTTAATRLHSWLAGRR